MVRTQMMGQCLSALALHYLWGVASVYGHLLNSRVNGSCVDPILRYAADCYHSGFRLLVVFIPVGNDGQDGLETSANGSFVQPKPPQLFLTAWSSARAQMNRIPRLRIDPYIKVQVECLSGGGSTSL